MLVTKAISSTATLILITFPFAFPGASAVQNGTTTCSTQNVTHQERQRIFSQFVKTFYINNDPVKAFQQHMTESYIQHNPTILSGRQTAIDAFKLISSAGGSNITLIQQGLSGDRAFVHYRLDVRDAPQPSAIVDIFRFEGGCIAEHWDVIQQRPANATNPLAMF